MYLVLLISQMSHRRRFNFFSFLSFCDVFRRTGINLLCVFPKENNNKQSETEKKKKEETNSYVTWKEIGIRNNKNRIKEEEEEEEEEEKGGGEAGTGRKSR